MHRDRNAISTINSNFILLQQGDYKVLVLTLTSYFYVTVFSITIATGLSNFHWFRVPEGIGVMLLVYLTLKPA